MPELSLVSGLDLPTIDGELKANGFIFNNPEHAQQVLLTQAYNYGYHQDQDGRFYFGVYLKSSPQHKEVDRILTLNMLVPPTSARLHKETATAWQAAQPICAAEACLGFLQLGWGNQRAEVLRRGVKFDTQDWLTIQHEILRAGPCKLYVSVESVRQSGRVTTPTGRTKLVELWYDQLEFLDGSYAYFTREGPTLKPPVDYFCTGWQDDEQPVPYAGDLARAKPLGRMH
jgi:hypothetical protein